MDNMCRVQRLFLLIITYIILLLKTYFVYLSANILLINISIKNQDISRRIKEWGEHSKKWDKVCDRCEQEKYWVPVGLFCEALKVLYK